MILEAFSKVLQQEYRETGETAIDILHRWLLAILSEAEPRDILSNVIHTEIAIVDAPSQLAFVARSGSGEILLNSLYLYCDSYERWQFGRWLHQLKPHSFNELSR